MPKWMFSGIGSIVIQRFLICEFAYLLKSSCNPQINTSSILMTKRMAENLSPPYHSQMRWNRAPKTQ